MIKIDLKAYIKTSPVILAIPIVSTLGWKHISVIISSNVIGGGWFLRNSFASNIALITSSVSELRSESFSSLSSFCRDDDPSGEIYKIFSLR